MYYRGEYAECCPTGTYVSTLPPARPSEVQDIVALGKDIPIHMVAIHIVPNYSASKAELTTTQPGAAGAVGAAERLPYMHLKQTLLHLATCHRTI